MRLFNTPAGEVHALRFSPDGRSIYFVTREAYDSFSGLGNLDPLPDIPGLSGLASLANVPDLAAINGLNRLYQHAYRLDTQSGEVTGKWSFSGSEVAIFTPDFRSLYHSVSVAVAGGEFDLRRLDLATGENVPVYEANVPYPSDLAFTPNGHILAIAGQHYAGDGEYRVHRLDVWHRTELEPIQFDASCLAYSPNGRLLATGNRANGVRVWVGKTLSEQWAQPAAELAWALDGRLAWGMKEQLGVARPDSQEPVRVWDTAGGELSALAFSPDGRLLLAGMHRGQCAFHDPAAGREGVAFDWGIGPIHSVAFSPDGLTCAAGGENGRVVVWDVDA